MNGINKPLSKEISIFRGRYLVLSNFYEDRNYPFTFMGLTFISAEPAYQSAKSLDPEIRKKFCNLHPREAKIYGNRIELRPNWDNIKDDIMYEVIRAKFSPHPALQQRLVDTYPSILIEGNTWHDNHFGSCSCLKCANKEKENVLGKLLMRFRDEIIGAKITFIS